MNRISIIIALIGSFCIAACSSQHEKPTIISSELLLTDSLLQIVTVDSITLETVNDDLAINGRITFNQSNVSRVFPTFDGIVTDVKVEIGDYVNKGDILAVVRSGEVADYEKQRKEASQQVLIAQRNLESTQDMYASGMASERDLLQAQQEISSAEAEIRKINEIFSIYHIRGNSFYEMKAPSSGFIIEKNIHNEMQLRPDQNEEMFIISGLEDVWVMGDVYESDINKVHHGDIVRITTLAYPDKELSGKIDKVYPMLNEESKTLGVRIKVNNENMQLKPGMFAQILISNSKQTKELPCIDSQTIIFENGKNYVVTVGANSELASQEVIIYKQHNNKSYIESGINSQDRIINKNALLVYNALNIN